LQCKSAYKKESAEAQTRGNKQSKSSYLALMEDLEDPELDLDDLELDLEDKSRKV